MEGGREGGRKKRKRNKTAKCSNPPSMLAVVFDSHFKLTDGGLVLSNTTALSPRLPGSAPSSGSTLRDTEVIMA